LPQAHPQFHPHHLAPQFMPQPQFAGPIPPIKPEQISQYNMLNYLIRQTQEQQQRIP
jgi:hypothetical protein